MSSFEIYLPETHIDESTEVKAFTTSLKTTELRSFAFFDELLTGYILLKKEKNQQPVDTSLELYIQGLNDELVNLKSITLKNPIKSEPTRIIYKFVLFLSYPKIKLGDSQLHLKVQTTLNNKRKSMELQHSNHTLANFYPSEHRNILDGIKPTITTRQNRFLMSDAILSDSLIKHNKLDSSINENQTQFPVDSPDVQIIKELAIPTVRILNLRVRNIRIKKNSILSTIDVELSSKFKPLNTPIALNSINYKFQNAVQPKFTHDFPITISKDDSFSFSFQLDSNDIFNYKTLIEIDYSFNSHHIKTKWIINIEFNAPQHNLKRLSSGSLSQTSPSQSSSISNGLTIKFLGNKKVNIGEVFKLRAHIINNSKRNRNLVMVFNSTPEAFLPNIPKVKSIIQTNVNLLKFYSTSRIKTTGVLSLVNEVHFKVNSDQVSESEIYLIGLEVGVFNLEGVKLVDLATGESMSCEKLLEVVVVE